MVVLRDGITVVVCADGDADFDRECFGVKIDRRACGRVVYVAICFYTGVKQMPDR